LFSVLLLLLLLLPLLRLRFAHACISDIRHRQFAFCSVARREILLTSRSAADHTGVELAFIMISGLNIRRMRGYRIAPELRRFCDVCGRAPSFVPWIV
jgi:hypothetical protein